MEIYIKVIGKIIKEKAKEYIIGILTLGRVINMMMIG